MEPTKDRKLALIDAEIEQLEEVKFTMGIRIRTNKLLKKKAGASEAATAFAECEAAIEALEKEKKDLGK